MVRSEAEPPPLVVVTRTSAWRRRVSIRVPDRGYKRRGWAGGCSFHPLAADRGEHSVSTGRVELLWQKAFVFFLLWAPPLLFENSAEKEKTFYQIFWAVISRQNFCLGV